jgi:hypothetical protein
MKNYSDEQKYEARNADIIDFLQRTEGYSFKRSGTGYRCNEHNSLVVYPDRKGFYWNSQNIGGANAIDWCLKVKNENFPQAMAKIVGNPDDKITHKTENIPKPEVENRAFSLPEKAENNNRAVAYLCKTRHIDYNIVQDILKDRKLFQDNRGNVVFVGYNGATPAYAFKRTTNTIGENAKWRGEETGSKKEYGFRMDGIDKSKVYVFESPIDALSHASIINEAFKNPQMHKDHTRLALGGVNDNALAEFAKNNPHLKEIIFALDNDEAGRNATVKLAEKYEKMGYSVRMVKPKGKDFNEDLCNKRSQQETANSANTKKPKATVMA